MPPAGETHPAHGPDRWQVEAVTVEAGTLLRVELVTLDGHERRTLTLRADTAAALTLGAPRHDGRPAIPAEAGGG